MQLKNIRDMADLVEYVEENADDINRESLTILENWPGQVWLVTLNNYANEPHISQWDGMTTPYNARAVISAFDQTLLDMIVSRKETPYTGTAADSKLVDAIFNRISELNGKILWWY